MGRTRKGSGIDGVSIGFHVPGLLVVHLEACWGLMRDE